MSSEQSPGLANSVPGLLDSTELDAGGKLGMGEGRAGALCWNKKERKHPVGERKRWKREGRQDDGDLGGEERKIFEEPLPDMWLWKVAEEGGGVCKVFAVCRECTLFPYTHMSWLSQEATHGWQLISLHSTGGLFPMQRRIHCGPQLYLKDTSQAGLDGTDSSGKLGSLLPSGTGGWLHRLLISQSGKRILATGILGDAEIAQ